MRLIRPTIAAAALVVAACQPAPEGDVRPTSGPASVMWGEDVPETYDWFFTPHGGSGDLDFGDGDWAEGVSLFHLSCLPASREVEMSWGDEGESVLTSGTATETFGPAARAATDHPVLAALQDTGALSIGHEGTDLRLAGKTGGREDLARFFAYCDNGPEPRVPADAAEAANGAGDAPAV